MKKLLYVLTGLCLLAGLFAGCEKPLEETGGSNGGSVSGGDGITTLEGIVTSKTTGKPLLLASVTLLPADKLTVTDTAGSFRFRDIAAGTYKLQVKRTGYAPYTSGDIKVADGKTVQYDIALEAEQSDLQIQNTSGEVIEELSIEDDATQGTFVLKNTGSKIIEWEIPKLAVDWISDFSMQSGKLAPGASETITFSIDRTKLSDGLNETTLYIGSGVGDKMLIIRVGVERSFSLLDEAGEEISELDLSGVDQYSFRIKNTGNDVLTWSVGKIEADWLTFVGITEGKLEVGKSESRTLRVNRTQLEEGTYETTLVFRSNVGSSVGDKELLIKVGVERSFRITDYYGEEISELDLSGVDQYSFRIKNTGNDVLTWSVGEIEADWLTFVGITEGKLEVGESASRTLKVDLTRLEEEGTYETALLFHSNAGEKTLPVKIKIEMGIRLEETDGAEISELNLGEELRGAFNIKNTGTGLLNYTVSCNKDWLSLAGENPGTVRLYATTTIGLGIDWTKLQEGTNEAILTIGSAAGDKQLPVRISKHDVGTVGSDYVETAFGMELQMVAVEGGMFEMGATSEQGSDADGDEKPVHNVVLDGFYIGKYEVTQAQWKAVMGTEPSEFKGDNLPVEQVSWNEAVEFCKKLSEATGKKYVLPTEAQWEYAARGGNQSQHYKYAGSNNIGEVAWYSTNSSSKTHPVGTKKANELGIYDMSGNVWEWCSDWYGSYSSSSTVNPQGPSSGSSRVERGGGWRIVAGDCRVSYRGRGNPGIRFSNLGFRVAVLL